MSTHIDLEAAFWGGTACKVVQVRRVLHACMIKYTATHMRW